MIFRGTAGDQHCALLRVFNSRSSGVDTHGEAGLNASHPIPVNAAEFRIYLLALLSRSLIVFFFFLPAANTQMVHVYS